MPAKPVQAIALTSAERLQARRFGLLFLLGTSVGWGLNWPAMKLLLLQLPPLLARGSARLVSINKVLMADNISLKAKVGASGTVTLVSLTSRRPTSWNWGAPPQRPVEAPLCMSRRS